MPIRQYLDVCTSHVTEDDMQKLSGDGGVIHSPHEHGAWVWVPEEDHEEMSEYISEHVKPLGFSDAFINLLRHARKQGCDWINLDADADIEPELPTFDW